MTLLTSLLGAHSEVTSWYLPFSTRKSSEPLPFQHFEDILEQYNHTFSSHQIEHCDTWVISESTAHEESIALLKQSLGNIAADNQVSVEIIWEIRSLTHTYLSQTYAAKRYWGASELKVNEQGYAQYVDFVKKSYANIHSLIFPFSFTRQFVQDIVGVRYKCFV